MTAAAAGHAGPVWYAARRGPVTRREGQTDQELVDAAGRGDVGAFEALYRRHREWVGRLALRFTGEREMALDVVQETFIYLLRKVPTLRLTARLTTFLYPVVKHTAQAARRKRRIGPAAGGEMADEDLWIVGDVVEAGEEAAALRAAVGRLGAGQREALLMRYVAGMSLEEIAAALGVPLGTVKSRLHGAVRTLEAGMAPRPGFKP